MGFGNYKKTVWVNVTQKEYERHQIFENIVMLIITIIFIAFLVWWLVST
jgi:flagellar biogenesis protein FliO